VTEFVLAQCLVVSEGESQALESLARFQMRVLFGQMQQVKVLDCLESETEDFESDGESESKEEEYDESDEESNDNSDDESDESSDDEYKVDSSK
jgi:hypothetical protein